MIKYYLKGLICIARMGLYTHYELLVMRTKDNGKGYQTGSTKYHSFKRMWLLKHIGFLKNWSILVKQTNGRLHTIGIQIDKEMSLLDCVAHLERKRIRREQFNQA